MTLQLFLHYSAMYLVIGFISAWIINEFIKYYEQEPYTPFEIFLMILLWPVNVLVFVAGFIYSLFQ